MTRRLRWLTAGALALVPGMLLAQGGAKRPMTIDDMMALKTVGAASISPNGAQVVFTVSAWEHPNATPAKGDTAKGDKHEVRSHIWLVPADGSRPARQISF